MIKYSKFIAVLFCIVSNFSSLANTQQKIIFERELESRIGNIIRSIDPHHRVSVDVVYKTISAPLPGTDLIISNFSTVRSSVKSSDIQKINVKIFTSKSPLPIWLSDEVRKSVKFPGISVDLEFAPLPLEQLTFLEKENISGMFIKDSVSDFQKKIDRFYWFFIGSILLVVAFTALLFKLRSNQFQTTLNNEISRLIEGFSGASQNPSIKNALPQLDSAQHKVDPLRNKTDPEIETENPFVEASVQSIVSILSDCYWCQVDDYAAWIWRKVPFPMKTQILDSTDFLWDYTSYLSKVPPKRRSYHEEPYYLGENKLINISQIDLQAQLLREPSLWHFLSLMRRETLNIKLRDRAKFLQSPRTMTEKAWSKITTIHSSKRAFAFEEKISISSLQEELEIFKQPSIVPLEMLHSLESLVPLALCTLEDRREILSRFQSDELASAWIGPREVLSKLEEALSEKKLKILNSYLEKSTPSRQSATFFALTIEAKNKIQIEAPIKKAA